MSRRKAFSIVELMTVVALTGIVMSLISSAFVTLYQLDASANRNMAWGDTLSTLELQLRQDVHDSHDARIVEDSLQLSSETSKIKWSTGPEEMTREVQSVGQVTARERWLLPYSYQAEWSLKRLGEFDWLTLQLTDERHSAAKRGAVVECRVGANLPAKEAQP